MNDFGFFEEATSRAFWDTEDEENSSTGPTFTPKWLTDVPISIKTLVIAAGKIVTEIFDGCIASNAEKICTINNDEGVNVASIYKLDEATSICTVSAWSLNLTIAGKLVEAISTIISKSKRVIAFTDEIVSRLNVPERERADGVSMLWKSLSNEKGREERSTAAPPLKHPNFVAGIAAGAVVYAEMLDIPGNVYILYAAEDVYSGETTEATIKLFKEATNSDSPSIDSISKTFDNNKLKLYI